MTLQPYMFKKTVELQKIIYSLHLSLFKYHCCYDTSGLKVMTLLSETKKNQNQNQNQKKKRKKKSRHSIRAGHIKIRKYNWYVKIKIREILVKLYRICYNLTLSKWFSDTNFSSVNLIMLNHSLILCYIFSNWRIPL